MNFIHRKYLVTKCPVIGDSHSSTVGQQRSLLFWQRPSLSTHGSHNRRIVPGLQIVQRLKLMATSLQLRKLALINRIVVLVDIVHLVNIR